MHFLHRIRDGSTVRFVAVQVAEQICPAVGSIQDFRPGHISVSQQADSHVDLLQTILIVMIIPDLGDPNRSLARRIMVRHVITDDFLCVSRNVIFRDRPCDELAAFIFRQVLPAPFPAGFGTYRLLLVVAAVLLQPDRDAFRTLSFRVIQVIPGLHACHIHLLRCVEVFDLESAGDRACSDEPVGTRSVSAFRYRLVIDFLNGVSDAISSFIKFWQFIIHGIFKYFL